MRIEYKKSITVKIMDAVSNANLQNKEIEAIYLNYEEWQEFANYIYKSTFNGAELIDYCGRLVREIKFAGVKVREGF